MRGKVGRWKWKLGWLEIVRVGIVSCLEVEENCELKCSCCLALPTPRLDGPPTVLVLNDTTSIKPLVWSYSCSTLATLDSALLHSSSCCRHDYHTCSRGPNCTAFVGCHTTEHPSPRNAQVPKIVTSTPSLPGYKRSLFFSLGLFCLSVCLSVLAPVR